MEWGFFLQYFCDTFQDIFHDNFQDTFQDCIELRPRFEFASEDRMGEVMSAFADFYVEYDPCWRATGFWEHKHSPFYKVAKLDFAV